MADPVRCQLVKDSCAIIASRRPKRSRKEAPLAEAVCERLQECDSSAGGTGDFNTAIDGVLALEAAALAEKKREQEEEEKKREQEEEEEKLRLSEVGVVAFDLFLIQNAEVIRQAVMQLCAGLPPDRRAEVPQSAALRMLKGGLANWNPARKPRFRSYYYGVLRNVARETFRSIDRGLVAIPEGGVAAPGSWDALENADLQFALREALSDSSSEEQAVLLDYYGGGLSQEAAARRIGLTRDKFRTLLRKFREGVRRSLPSDLLPTLA